MNINLDSATPNQLKVLDELLSEEEKKRLNRKWLTKSAASALIQAHRHKWEQLPVTAFQEHYLKSRLLWYPGITRGDACRLIEQSKNPA
jgi:hypothetical protein